MFGVWRLLLRSTKLQTANKMKLSFMLASIQLTDYQD